LEALIQRIELARDVAQLAAQLEDHRGFDISRGRWSARGAIVGALQSRVAFDAVEL
jgi:hypothetical protein